MSGYLEGGIGEEGFVEAVYEKEEVIHRNTQGL